MAFLWLLRRQSRSPSASRARLRPRQLPQDRREGRRSRPLCGLPDGDGHFTRPVHGHLADDRGALAAASHINSVALLVVTSSIETTGEARLEEAFFLLVTAMRLYWVTNALIHSPCRHDDYTQLEYSIPSD
jgi:hypothetical protein